MPSPPNPEPRKPLPLRNRLTPDEVLEKMLAVRREFELEESFRRPDHNPWVRLIWVLGAGFAFTTIALLVLQRALTPGAASLVTPKANWINAPAPIALFLEQPGGTRMALRSGSSLMIGTSNEPVHLVAEGAAEDRQALLMAEDDFGRLSTVWPHGGARRSAPCPRDCTSLELVLRAHTLPAGNAHLALWLGPDAMDASNLQHLGRTAPPTLPGARASTSLTLER